MTRTLMTLAALSVAGAALGAQAPNPPSGAVAGNNSPRFDGWNVAYQPAAGWQVVQQVGRVHILTSSESQARIFVAPGAHANFNEAAADISKLYTALGMQASPVEPPSEATFAGLRAMTATYQSQGPMGVITSRIVAMLTPHGTGVVLVAMSSHDDAQQLRAIVEQMAGTVQAGAPQVNQRAVHALAGRWMYYQGRANGTSLVSGGSSHSHEEFVTFDGQGRFQWQSSSAVNVTASGTAGYAGSATARSDAGTYTVIGSTIVVDGRQGRQSYDIQQFGGNKLVVDGQTWARTT